MTDGQTDGQTDRQTDGQAKRGVEQRSTRLKKVDKSGLDVISDDDISEKINITKAYENSGPDKL